MTVSNEDLRVDLAKLQGQMDAVVYNTTDIKKTIESNNTERRSEVRRIETLEREGATLKGSIAILRWVVGLLGGTFVGGVLWVFSHVTDADQMNKLQEVQIRALERAQVVNSVREK